MLRMRSPRASSLAASLLALTLLASCAERISTEPSAPGTLAGPGASVVAPPGYIRIGVVPEAEEVRMGGTGSYRVLDATGRVLLAGSASEATVKTVSEAVRAVFWRLQVQCNRSEPYVRDWELRVQAAGYEPYTEYVPGARCFRMRVGRFPTRAAAVAEQPELFRLGLSPGRTGGFPVLSVAFDGVTAYQVTIGGAVATSLSPVRIVPQDGLLTIGTRRYRGVGEVRLNAIGSLAAINELHMEDYLLGVVPRELGPIAFPEIEALKAQAIAARTYAYANMGKRRANGYDLLTTTSDQVYGGYNDEHPLSSQAVTETAGLVAKHDGRLISALYSSTSGGFTANSEDVYASAVPYLRGVPDAERGKALDHVPSLEVFRSHRNPTALRNAAEGDFESDWSKLHRWYVDWTPQEIRTVLSEYFRTDLGVVLEINVAERSSSGRVKTMEFVTDNGTSAARRDTVRKDAIRSALKFYNAAGSQTSLYSTLVYVEPVIDPRTRELKGFEAWGGGWGHGVGLSQTGAVGMAAKGYTFEEILKHYYRGIEVAPFQP